MKYIVTGGAGFIGSNLVDELVMQGHEVVVLDNLSTGLESNVNSKAKLVVCDISACNKSGSFRKLAEEMMKGVDTVFHLAALARVQPSIENPYKFNQINEGGTLNMLEVAANAGVRRFVFSSSSSVYGDVTEEELPTKETNSFRHNVFHSVFEKGAGFHSPLHAWRAWVCVCICSAVCAV